MALLPPRLFTLIKRNFDLIVFDETSISSLAQNHTVKIKSIFDTLIDEVLLEIKGAEMRLTLLIMLLNDVNVWKVGLLKKRKNKSKAVKNYLTIVDTFSANLINEAKAALR